MLDYAMNVIGMKDGNRENSIKRIIIEMQNFSQKFMFLLENNAKIEQYFKEIEDVYKILAGNFINETGKWLFRADGELVRNYNIQEFNNGYLTDNQKMVKKVQSIERNFFCISYILASNEMPKIISSHLLKFDCGFSDFLSKNEKNIVTLMSNCNSCRHKKKKTMNMMMLRIKRGKKIMLMMLMRMRMRVIRKNLFSFIKKTHLQLCMRRKNIELPPLLIEL
ncbi:MAG: hypothetical protein GY821_05115 [Gammaproteobacteria bacterium]|nr:hypothetical protein [Gammaproteobacteria bacterium]